MGALLSDLIRWHFQESEVLLLTCHASFKERYNEWPESGQLALNTIHLNRTDIQSWLTTTVATSTSQLQSTTRTFGCEIGNITDYCYLRIDARQGNIHSGDARHHHRLLQRLFFPIFQHSDAPCQPTSRNALAAQYTPAHCAAARSWQGGWKYIPHTNSSPSVFSVVDISAV